jgi:hypothetical protein
VLIFFPGLLYNYIMKLDQNPFFRRVVIPWYDSDLSCLLISIFTALVFFFSAVGVNVALEHERYHRHCWVPLLLMFLSSIVLGANLIRILIRMAKRRAEEKMSPNFARSIRSPLETPKVRRSGRGLKPVIRYLAKFGVRLSLPRQR